jgi:hypothetical protein
MPDVPTNNSRLGARPARDWWLGGLLTLLTVVLAGLGYAWLARTAEPTDPGPRSAGEFPATAQAFLADLEAGRWEAAYQTMTVSFRERVSPQDFAERAQRYRAFKQRPGTRGVEGTAGDTIWGDHGPSRQTFTNTLEDREGSRLRYSVTLVRADSGSDPRVAEFTVE